MSDVVEQVIAANIAASIEPVRPKRELPRFVRAVLRRITGTSEQLIQYGRSDVDWPFGLRLLAMVRVHERTGKAHVMNQLETALAARIECGGKWIKPLARVGQILPAYALLHLYQHEPSPRWECALHEAADFLMRDCPREADGSLRYVPHRPEILVDTLGMVCPFLAAYGGVFHNSEASELGELQLRCMIAGNLNERSRLPFHGYHADAAYQLGLHGWGRGVGWYLMGLVDYLIEVPEPHNRILLKALQDAAAALMRYQRPDGHWAWVVPMPDQGADSSVTAFCGYALARARHAGLLAADPVSALDNARNALIRLIDRTGQVGSSSGECRGLGVYSMNFGPEPWSQAMTAAFFAVWPE